MYRKINLGTDIQLQMGVVTLPKQRLKLRIAKCENILFTIS